MSNKTNSPKSAIANAAQTVAVSNLLTNANALPAPEQPKIAQHIICKQYAEAGYKAKQTAQLTGISYNNVAWYYSKYNLTDLANVKLSQLYPEIASKIAIANELPNQPKLPVASKAQAVSAELPVISKQQAKANAQQAKQAKK